MEERKKLLDQIISELDSLAEKIDQYNNLNETLHRRTQIINITWYCMNVADCKSGSFRVNMKSAKNLFTLPNHFDGKVAGYHCNYEDIGNVRIVEQVPQND